MKFNTKEFLIHYLPSIFDYIRENKINWKKLDEKYEKRYLELLLRYKNGHSRYEMSIFEILMYAKKGEDKAIIILNFINQLIDNLHKTLSEKEKKLIFSNFENIINTNLNRNYLNFLGELAFLQFIKNDKEWKLIKTEEKNSVGKGIDFTFRTGTSKSTKFEILNIHLTKSIDIKNNGVEKFLKGRIAKKIEDKTKENTSIIDFIIVPIVWGEYEELEKISSYINANNWKIKNSLKPFTFINFKEIGNSNFNIQKFLPINQIFL